MGKVERVAPAAGHLHHVAVPLEESSGQAGKPLIVLDEQEMHRDGSLCGGVETHCDPAARCGMGPMRRCRAQIYTQSLKEC